MILAILCLLGCCHVSAQSCAYFVEPVLASLLCIATSLVHLHMCVSLGVCLHDQH
jgi:hypothetical protein